jgi:hypothetical protein
VSAGNNDETLCPVHHVPLKRGKPGLFYGLVAEDPCDILDRIEAKEKYFPYANSSVYGGGCPDSNLRQANLSTPKFFERLPAQPDVLS